MKEKLRGVFFSSPVLKKIYCAVSHVKGWIRCNKALATPIRKFQKDVPGGVFLVFTPEHANLGDHAIALAETRLLQKNNIPFLEITGAQLFKLAQYGFLDMLNGFPIFINGGGNLGTLWPDIEEMIRLIIEKNPASPITIFPSTIHYENDEGGKGSFDLSKEIYNGHNDLTIYAREQISFDVMKGEYDDVRLMPDMVLSLDERRTGERKGCILCLRDDVERTLSISQREQVKYQAELLFGVEVKEVSTVRDKNIAVSDREIALQQIFDELGGAELVITDRLHGMIFCAITGTKCVVLDSKSPKLRGCYRWICNLPYIIFADKVEDVTAAYLKIRDAKGTYQPADFAGCWNQLKEEICQRAKRPERSNHV